MKMELSWAYHAPISGITTDRWITSRMIVRLHLLEYAKLHLALSSLCVRIHLNSEFYE